MHASQNVIFLKSNFFLIDGYSLEAFNYPNVFLRPDLESSRRDASVGAIFKVLSIILIFGLIMGVNGGQMSFAGGLAKLEIPQNRYQ